MNLALLRDADLGADRLQQGCEVPESVGTEKGIGRYLVGSADALLKIAIRDGVFFLAGVCWLGEGAGSGAGGGVAG